MKKRILLALLLATTSLFAACGNAASQDTTGTFGTPDTSTVPSTQEQVADAEEQIEEYIPADERTALTYKPYFEMTNSFYGKDYDNADDDIMLEIFKEQNAIATSHLINFTTADGTQGAIRVPIQSKDKSHWHFDSLQMMNNGFVYVPSNTDTYEEFGFALFDLTLLGDETLKVKDCTDEASIKAFTSWFPIGSSARQLEPNANPKYNIDIGDTYAKITYETDYTYTFKYEDGYDHAYYCPSYTLVYDDYENQKRYILIYGKYTSSSKGFEEFLNSIEIISEEERFSERTGYWSFPEGMEGYTAKTLFNNGMSRNITTYTDSTGYEMNFHWYGVADLGTYAYQTGNILTLCEGNDYYKLNAQAIPLADIADPLNPGSYGLMETEHLDPNGHLDNYGDQIVYPIVTDDGYKGYATVLAGSYNEYPEDYYYCFTYVEREDVYDDARALELIGSLDYHLE